MTKQKITRLKSRIKKAKNSLNVMGEMTLRYEIDAMNQTDRIELRNAMLNGRKPVSYDYLNDKINKRIETDINAN